MSRRFGRFWLHDTLALQPGVHVWRASMGSDPARHTFYVRLIQVDVGQSGGRALFEQARQQAVRCKSMRHPHLLQVYGWGEAEGFGWLAAEHPMGYDVASLMRTLRRARLRVPAPLAVHIAMQSLRGLDWLHRHNMVHRAVHAGAVFVGAGNRVQVAAPSGELPFGFHAPVSDTPAAASRDAAQDVVRVARLLHALLTGGGDDRVEADAPASVAHVLRRAKKATVRQRRPWTAAALYRHLAACNVADPMAECAPLLRYWVQTACRAGDVARQAGALPAWAQAPMQALFGAPKHVRRAPSLLRRIMPRVS